MANPFSIFRRNQKVLMAALTIMAMIAFCLLPLFSRTGDPRATADRAVVTTQKYGNLTRSELSQLVRNRYLVLNFLTQAQWQAMLPSLPPGTTPAVLEYYHRMQTQQAQEVLRQIFGDTTERAVGDLWLLAHRADELGIVVSDAAVVQYIQDTVRLFSRGGTFSAADLQRVLAMVRASELQLLEALRTELKAHRLQQLFYPSVQAVTPGQRWESFQRLNRRASVELVALPVEKFIDKVSDPSDADLRKFFDEHKNTLPNPASPDPGFREPQRVGLQYFQGDVTAFMDLKSVSNEDVRQYYEKFKATRYLDTSLPSTEPPAETKPATKPEQKPAATPEAKPVEKPAAKAEPKPTEKPTAKPEAKPAPKKPNPAEGKKDSKSSSMWSNAAVRLVADVKEPAKDAKQATPAQTEAKGVPSKPAAPESKPATEKPAEKKPSADNKPGDAKAESAPTKPEAKPAPKYIPLEKVQEEIRREIARERAKTKIAAAMRPLQEQMTEYGAAAIRYELDHKTNPNLPAPPMPDLESLAKQAHLKPIFTGLVTQWELTKLNIGRAVVAGSGEPFSRYAFATLRRFHPLVTIDPLVDDRYLVWKTEEVKEHTPTFDAKGVKEKVLRTWKLIQARKLATDEANRIVDRVRQAKHLMKDITGLSVLEPPPFAWMTQGMALPNAPPPTPTLSTVEGVEMAGKDFMQTVFSLPQEGLGVTTNEPKSVVYVVQLVGFQPPPEELWQDFQTTDFARYAPVAQRDQRQIVSAWLEEMKTRSGFKWLHEPDRRDEEPRSSQGAPDSGGEPIDF